jgi:hypothetical protein
MVTESSTLALNNAITMPSIINFDKILTNSEDIMIKQVFTTLLITVIGSISFAQINSDAKKVSRKGISKIVMDRGGCSISFDRDGRVTEMVYFASSNTQLYRFDSLGNWIYCVAFESRKKGGKYIDFIEQEVHNAFDDNGDLISQGASYNDPMVESGNLPDHADSSIYRKELNDSLLKISMLWFRSDAYYINDQRRNERSSFHEETELIRKLNDSTVQIDYYKINFKDTVEHNRLICYQNEVDSVWRIDVFDLESGTVNTSYTNCTTIKPFEYSCSYVNETGEIKNQTLKTRVIQYSTDSLYEGLPRSNSSDDRYSYCINPLKALKSSKKAYGKNSIKIFRY